MKVVLSTVLDFKSLEDLAAAWQIVLKIVI